MSMQVVYILAISLFRHLLQLLTVGLHNCLDNCVQELQHINGVVDFSKCDIKDTTQLDFTHRFHTYI